MAFSEPQKLSVKRKSHFRCVVCRTPGVEIHHILPQAEGGADIIDNAAPLCPTCHEIYGANPIKRKFIREARDFWYELCERDYPPGVQQSIAELQDLVVASNSRLDGIAKHIFAKEAATDPADGSSDLNIFGVMEHILSRYQDEAFPEYELLFSPLIWNKEDLPEVRERMFKEYGELFLERLALFAMRELGVDIRVGFTDEQFGELIHSLDVYSSIFEGHRKGLLSARLDDDGHFLWRLLEKQEDTACEHS